MRTISNFHQSHKYTDNIGIVVELNFSIVSNRLVGTLKTSHPNFSVVTAVFEGMKPDLIKELEKSLIVNETNKKIKDLVFGRLICVSEINGRCVEIPNS